MSISSIFRSENKKDTHRKAPKTVQQSIPYRYIFSGGTIETEEGVYCRAYWLDNINFDNEAPSKQEDIFHSYEDILNAFPPSIDFQIVIQNYPLDKQSLFDTVRYGPVKDGRNRFRQEKNEELYRIIKKSNRNVRQDKYLVIRVKDDDVESAMTTLDKQEKILRKNFSRLSPDVTLRTVTAEERLRSLYHAYVQDESIRFYNDVDAKNNPVFNFDKLFKFPGSNSKDLIAPTGMEFRAGCFKLGEAWGCAMYLQDPGNLLSTSFLSQIADTSCNLLLSIHHTPLDTGKSVKMMETRVMNIDADIIKRQIEASKEGYSADILPATLQEARQETLDLRKDVLKSDQKLFDITFTICIFARSKKELDANVTMIRTAAANRLCKLKILSFQQEQGLNSSLPLARKDLFISRLYTTQSAAVFMPYTMLELDQERGFYYGTNQITGSPIFYWRLSGDNYNGLSFGSPGKGKSLFQKNEIINVILSNGIPGGRKHRVYVIDPEDEYGELARRLGGEVIDLSPGSKTFMNPLDMDLNYDEADPVGAKIDYVISLIEVMLGKDKSITPTAKSIVARCVKTIYQAPLNHLKALHSANPSITSDVKAMPTLSHLYHELKAQPEAEAKTVASILEMYINGTFETFSNRTEVKTNTDFCVYNIKNLGTGSKSLGLFICLNDVINRMFENYKQGYWTWFYIDEAYLCLQNETAANFLMEFWKRARKWRGVPTAIMQNPEDLLQSSQAQRILANSTFVSLFSMEETDRMTIGSLLKIPQEMLDYTRNAPSGSGLLYTPRTLVPFSYDINLDTELGRIITTKATDE